MYPATPTFWLEPTDEVAVGLRRYADVGASSRIEWSCGTGYHSAIAYTGRDPAEFTDRDGGGRHLAVRPIPNPDDPAWPTVCEHACGYEFTTSDRYQAWQELLYRRSDTGELRVMHPNAPAPDAPAAEPGATWDAWWMPFSRGDDGIYLMVRCPNGRDWAVDSQASNCTRPGEPHHCWVRHGNPREARVTVDKNGNTCAAGAGSILAGDYHGFLQAGVLTAG